jgi:hypothetical protein
VPALEPQVAHPKRTERDRLVQGDRFDLGFELRFLSVLKSPFQVSVLVLVMKIIFNYNEKIFQLKPAVR